MKRLKGWGNRNRWEDLQTTVQVRKGDEEGLGRKPQPSKDSLLEGPCASPGSRALSPVGNSRWIVASVSAAAGGCQLTPLLTAGSFLKGDLINSLPSLSAPPRSIFLRRLSLSVICMYLATKANGQQQS